VGQCSFQRSTGGGGEGGDGGLGVAGGAVDGGVEGRGVVNRVEEVGGEGFAIEGGWGGRTSWVPPSRVSVPVTVGGEDKLFYKNNVLRSR